MRKHAANLMAMAIGICVVPCLVELEGAELQTCTAEFGAFDQKDYEILELVGGADISDDALQLTPDTITNTDAMLGLRSGRVLLKHPFKMWEHHNSTAVASFNTSFLFRILGVRGGVSQGLAFVIAPDLRIPADSTGPFLGLTSSSTDGSQANKDAVEADGESVNAMSITVSDLVR